MRKIILGIALILVASACSISIPSGRKFEAGNVISETREVSGFHAIEVSGGSDIDITQGDEEALVIEADENMMEYIESRVDNGILYLGIKEGHILDGSFSLNVVKYHLKVKDLDSISLSGATDLSMGSLKTGDLQIDMSGASTMAIDDLLADSLDLSSSGASDVKLAGSCPQQQIFIDGGGKYQADDLISKEVTIDASGAAMVEVSVSDTLSLSLSGASQVDYYGDPNVSQSVSGASEVNSHPAK